MRHDFHDDIGRVCNKVQNVYTVVRKTFKSALYALQKTFSDIINTAMRHDFRDCIDKIWSNLKMYKNIYCESLFNQRLINYHTIVKC